MPPGVEPQFQANEVVIDWITNLVAFGLNRGDEPS